MYSLRLDGYDPDLHHDAAVAFRIRARPDELFSAQHQHRKGQLIMALHGAITCDVECAMWMVPPQYAVWIASQQPRNGRRGALLSLHRTGCGHSAGTLLYVKNVSALSGVDPLTGDAE